MKKWFRPLLLFFIVICLSHNLVYAQEMPPQEVVQKQLEFYNKRDITGFMSVIDPNIVFYDFSTGQKTMEGAKACRAFYRALFDASPTLHSKILTRTVFGNRVIDHEAISGRNGSDQILELVLIFEVKGEKIIKITVIKKEM
ncbi:nuclear transport factor 2 family protein [Maribacter sp. 2-571]|uniref:nuclear transport factor 2 family protein n=1 Tax=Maribacter sp. 2-571 TaxID=3417569 RepID=UPI003D342C1F